MQTENMATKMLIDATHAEETRVVVVDGNKVEEFDFESENKRQIAGNIYLAKVTRVEPSLQAAFVDYGGNRHGFLAFSEIHPDYYQIPVADREALMAEEEALANAQNDEDEDRPRRSSGGEGRSDGRSEGRNSRSRSRSRSRTRAEKTQTDDAVATSEISGMETIDLEDETAATAEVPEATSPMERVAETPVEEIITMMVGRALSEATAVQPGRARCASPARGATRSKRSSRSARSCWCRSSRKSAATRGRR